MTKAWTSAVPHGPYRQSERTEIYRGYADILLANDTAYRCFCTAEELDAVRKHQIAAKLPPRYPGTCRTLTPEQIDANIAAGKSFVIRLKIPLGETTFRDELRDPITFDHNNVDDQVLMKSDGFPTYHLANVVDDHLMHITDVIRAEEWISSTPKHVLLYGAFGWQQLRASGTCRSCATSTSQKSPSAKTPSPLSTTNRPAFSPKPSSTSSALWAAACPPTSTTAPSNPRLARWSSTSSSPTSASAGPRLRPHQAQVAQRRIPPQVLTPEQFYAELRSNRSLRRLPPPHCTTHPNPHRNPRPIRRLQSTFFFRDDVLPTQEAFLP